MAPRQPVQQHRGLLSQERPHLEHRLLVGTQHPLRREDRLGLPGRPGGEQQLGHGVRAGTASVACARPGRGRRQIPPRQGAAPASDRDHHRLARRLQGCTRIPHGGNSRTERARILGKNHRGADQSRHPAQLPMVTALQRVRHAHRHGRAAGRERRQGQQQVLDRIAGQNHDWTARSTTLMQAPGERLNLGGSLPPRHAAPAVAISLRDQNALRMLASPRGEHIHDTRRVSSQRITTAQNHRPVGAILPVNDGRAEHPRPDCLALHRNPPDSNYCGRH